MIGDKKKDNGLPNRGRMVRINVFLHGGKVRSVRKVEDFKKGIKKQLAWTLKLAAISPLEIGRLTQKEMLVSRRVILGWLQTWCPKKMAVTPPFFEFHVLHSVQ